MLHVEPWEVLLAYEGEKSQSQAHQVDAYQ
jgi:hypothetical protein